MQASLEPDDSALLREYVDQGSEIAFEAIVKRYANHVYGMALRRVGEPHLAQDVVQAVFLLLVRKASSLPRGTILLGWLSNTTRFVAQTALRGERRRVDREVAAMNDPSLNGGEPKVDWDDLSPHVDEALCSLGEKDRNVLLLRFYQQRSVVDVGRIVGIGEAATQKRISRAIEKLRKFLNRRGIKISGSSLLLLLSNHDVVAAPSGLAQRVIESSATGGASILSPDVQLLVQKSLSSMSMAAATKALLLVAAGVGAVLPVALWVSLDQTREYVLYDVSKDFTHDQNPSLVWSFGWCKTLGGVFKTLDYKKSVLVKGGAVIDSWQFGPANNPAVYRNSGGQSWDNGRGIFNAGDMWYHAGENGSQQNFGVIRFTVPNGGSGLHTVSVAASPHYKPSFAGDSDFYVLTNGVQVFGRSLNVRGSAGYTNNFYLSEGEAVDFAIGRGADGDLYASGLKITILINAPKPPREINPQ